MEKKEAGIYRFHGPSDVIDLKKLEKESQKLLYLGLLVGISMYAAVAAFYTFKKTEVTVVKPPTTELVIRRPRMQKAFEFKKKKIEKRTYVKREVSQRQPTRSIVTKVISGIDVVGRVASFEYVPPSVAGSVSQEMNISIDQGIQIEMTATREPEKQISMKDEMISLNDLDTGQFKAMVIQDPNDKRAIKGFVYIATAWGTQLTPPDNMKRAVINLVEAVNRYTKINAKVDTHLLLDSRKIFDVPFVYVISDKAFELTEIERKNLGTYLRNGGFVVADNATPLLEFSQAEASLRQMFRDALGADAKFLPIPNDHPLYHSFFDLDGPPQGSEIGMAVTTESSKSAAMNRNATMAQPVYYLEGIWLDKRLVAIYSDKGYCIKWKDLTNNDPQLKMGVDMVVFALTQTGSIAQQKMDLFSTTQ